MAHERAEWLHGPGFVKWLESHGFRARDVETSSSTMSKWRRGTPVGLHRADALLSRHYHHLSELPDDLWIQGVSRKAWPKEIKEAALRDYDAGVELADIHHRHGPARDTILKWARHRGR